MSEDRFGDLGEEKRRSAAERFEERDLTHPEPDAVKRPDPQRTTNRYAWLVGIVLFMGIAVLLFTTSLPNRGRGIQGVPAGSQLPDFAAPLLTSSVEKDPNVIQSEGADAGAAKACEVKGPEILNSCQLARKPAVITFVFDKAAECNPQVDRVERLRGSLDGVNFAVVYFSRKDRTELRKIVSRRGWKLPVVKDDGAVSNLYGVGGCPTTVFSYAGGKVRSTKLGPLTEDQLRREAEALKRPPV